MTTESFYNALKDLALIELGPFLDGKEGEGVDCYSGVVGALGGMLIKVFGMGSLDYGALDACMSEIFDNIRREALKIKMELVEEVVKEMSKERNTGGGNESN